MSPQEEQNQSSGVTRYTKELLSEHLAEISLEHKNLQLEIENWAEKIDNIKPSKVSTTEGFKSGGITCSTGKGKKNWKV